MKDNTQYIVFALKQKHNKVVFYGKKKITKQFTLEKFENYLRSKYDYNKLSYEEFEDSESAKLVLYARMKKYAYRYKGEKPLYNAEPPKKKKTKKAKKTKKSGNVAQVSLTDHQGELIMPVELVKKMAKKAYKLGYRDAKNGKKQETNQIDIIIERKK